MEGNSKALKIIKRKQKYKWKKLINKKIQNNYLEPLNFSFRVQNIFKTQAGSRRDSNERYQGIIFEYNQGKSD